MRVEVTNVAQFPVGRAGRSFPPGEKTVVNVPSLARLREIRACVHLRVRVLEDGELVGEVVENEATVHELREHPGTGEPMEAIEVPLGEEGEIAGDGTGEALSEVEEDASEALPEPEPEPEPEPGHAPVGGLDCACGFTAASKAGLAAHIRNKTG